MSGPPPFRVRQVRIRHSPEEGTTLAGTRFGDGLWSMLARGWLRGCWAWRRELGAYQVPGSVGQPAPNPEVVRRTVRALENLSVEVDVSDLPVAAAIARQ